MELVHNLFLFDTVFILVDSGLIDNQISLYIWLDLSMSFPHMSSHIWWVIQMFFPAICNSSRCNYQSFDAVALVHFGQYPGIRTVPKYVLWQCRSSFWVLIYYNGALLGKSWFSGYASAHADRWGAWQWCDRQSSAKPAKISKILQNANKCCD